MTNHKYTEMINKINEINDSLADSIDYTKDQTLSTAVGLLTDLVSDLTYHIFNAEYDKEKDD